MKRRPLVLMSLALVLMLLVGCNATQAAVDAQGSVVLAQAMQQVAQTQLTNMQAQVTALQQQAATQPALQPQVVALQAEVAKVEKVTATVTPYLAAATQAAAALQAKATAQGNVADGIATGAQIAGPLAAMIPTYGSLIALALGAVATGIQTVRKSKSDSAAAEAQAVAANVVQSLEAAKAAGHLTLTPQLTALLNTIQSPATKALVDAIQAQGA